MELKKLTKENIGGRSRKGIATVSFTQRGLVIMSHKAVTFLELNPVENNNSFVDVFEGDIRGEFFISKGTTYLVRRNGVGGAIFNCHSLCSLILEHTWTVMPHVYSEEIPKILTFIVCNNPIDDEENAGIFALLRKKP